MSKDLRTVQHVFRLASVGRFASGRLWTILAWLALHAALGLVTPYLLKVIIDRVLPEQNLALLWGVIGVGVVVYGLQSWSRYAGRWSAAELAEDVWYTLRARAFGHLQGLSLEYHRSSDIGDHVARAHYDTRNMKSLVASGIPSLVGFAVTIGGTVVALLVLAPTLTLIGGLAVPALAATAYVFRDKIRPLQKEVSRLRGEVYSALHGGLADAESVKTYALEDHFDERVRETGDRLRETNLEFAHYQATLYPIANFGISLALLGVLGVGGYFVVADALTVGTLVAFFVYISKSLGPIRGVPGLVLTWYRSVAAAERLEELFERDAALERPDNPITPPVEGAELIFDDVRFAYRDMETGDEHLALDGLDVTLPPGGRIAVLGPSGAGKSTMGKMIPRLFDPKDGDIRIGDRSLRELDLDAWRRRIGYVGQEVALFEGTIAENIRLGAPKGGVEREGVERIASIAGVDAIAEDREEGLEAEIGSEGTELSGGERKRVALARALVRDPEVLVLDQFAADIERPLCDRIMRAVRREFDLKILYIGHRVPAGMEPDRCLWMEGGRIVSERDSAAEEAGKEAGDGDAVNTNQ